MSDFSFNYPQSVYNLGTPQVIDISCIIINKPLNTTFYITPSNLPSGLIFNNTNGTIYGATSFSSLSQPVTYIVDASYSTAVLSTSIIISVNFLPVFNYPESPYILQRLNSVTITPAYLISNTQGIIYELISSPSLNNIGLSLNSSNGTITGIPDISSNVITYTIRANNFGIIYDTSLNISIENPPKITYPQSTYILTQGLQVNILPIITDVYSNFKYEIDGCILPLGLFFDSATAEISGIPTILTTYRNYNITIRNSNGSDTFSLSLNVIKTFLAPPVIADNFSSNTFLTDPVIAMRRKAEILNYKKNSSNLTKQQYFALLAKGNGPAAKRAWATQSDTYTDPNTSELQLVGNTLICNTNPIICSPTSSSDVPGPIMQLCYNPSAPLVGYNPPNRVKVNIGFKWPQESWQPGDNGFPRGKAGRGLFFG
jgi:hypothetical protein